MCRVVDIAFPVVHWVKIKGRKKSDKYVDLARELEHLWNMTVTVILAVAGTLGTVPRGFIRGNRTTNRDLSN